MDFGYMVSSMGETELEISLVFHFWFSYSRYMGQIRTRTPQALLNYWKSMENARRTYFAIENAWKY